MNISNCITVNFLIIPVVRKSQGFRQFWRPRRR